MKTDHKVVLLLLIVSHFVFSHVASAREPDWSLWAELLREKVTLGSVDGVRLNVIDYPGLKNDMRFSKLISQMETFPLSELRTQDEKKAFYINLYNIYAIKVVLDHWPLKSIKDAGSLFNPVWKLPAGRVGSRSVSLHEIEHEILRKMGDARIHMAIVCASVSCPDLRTEPYTASLLDQQLDAQSVSFLQNPKKGLRRDGDDVEVSRIFDWFEDDFDSHGGVDGFIRKYVGSIQFDDVDADLPYNWQLNIRR